MAETIVFIIFAAVALVGAVSIIMAKNTVYSAMGLLATMFAIAVLYVVLDAHFIAAVQVIIYAGAVMTLFLFVIMLVGVDKPDAYGAQVPAQRIMTIVVAVGFFAAIALAGQGSMDHRFGCVRNPKPQRHGRGSRRRVLRHLDGCIPLNGDAADDCCAGHDRPRLLPRGPDRGGGRVTVTDLPGSSFSPQASSRSVWPVCSSDATRS